MAVKLLRLSLRIKRLSELNWMYRRGLQECNTTLWHDERRWQMLSFPPFQRRHRHRFKPSLNPIQRGLDIHQDIHQYYHWLYLRNYGLILEEYRSVHSKSEPPDIRSASFPVSFITFSNNWPEPPSNNSSWNSFQREMKCHLWNMDHFRIHFFFTGGVANTFGTHGLSVLMKGIINQSWSQAAVLVLILRYVL